MGNIAVFTHSSGSEVVRNLRVRIKYNFIKLNIWEI